MTIGSKSQRKGRVAERELAAIFRANGIPAEPGAPESFGSTPDVTGVRGIHVECKRCEQLRLSEWVHQSEMKKSWSCPKSKGSWFTNLKLTRTPSGFGGSCAYWLCPRCGKRVRFLYFKNRGFLCRSCARLNYRCQQRTKGSTNHARDGLKLARDKLYWEPPFDICPAEFPYVTPDRPRYMHQTTYRRYLTRYRRYQEKYQRESMREMLAILRPFK